MPIRLSQTTVHRVFRQPDLSTVLILGCRLTIINDLLLQAEQADFTLMLKLLQCMQFPHIAKVLKVLYDGTQESTGSLPDMSVFDHLTTGTVHRSSNKHQTLADTSL